MPNDQSPCTGLHDGATPPEHRYFLNIARWVIGVKRRKQAWLLTRCGRRSGCADGRHPVGINYWNRLFYDALDQREGAALLQNVFLALGLVAAAAATAVALVHARMRLQIRWRGWLSKPIIGYWLADRRFYQMSVIENEGSNPEFRIIDDTRLATEPIVEFAIGLASAVLTAAAFVGILWSVGGAFTIPLGGGISIPGYMVIAALVTRQSRRFRR
jgi:putative ATP-binding cassette transporter